MNKCITCKFFEPTYVVKQGTPNNMKDVQKGECRRRSPDKIGFPIVDEHKWCGEYRKL